MRFSVKFGNGVVIRENTDRDTLIETLRYFGLEKAAQFKGDSFKGCKLSNHVSTISYQRVREGRMGL